MIGKSLLSADSALPSRVLDSQPRAILHASLFRDMHYLLRPLLMIVAVVTGFSSAMLMGLRTSEASKLPWAHSSSSSPRWSCSFSVHSRQSGYSGQSCRSHRRREPQQTPVSLPQSVSHTSAFPQLLLAALGLLPTPIAGNSSIIRGQDWDRNPVAGDWGLFRHWYDRRHHHDPGRFVQG